MKMIRRKLIALFITLLVGFICLKYIDHRLKTGKVIYGESEEESKDLKLFVRSYRQAEGIDTGYFKQIWMEFEGRFSETGIDVMPRYLLVFLPKKCNPITHLKLKSSNFKVNSIGYNRTTFTIGCVELNPAKNDTLFVEFSDNNRRIKTTLIPVSF